jgi:hypothetical protein
MSGTESFNIKDLSSYFMEGSSNTGANPTQGAAADNSNATHSTRTVNIIDHSWSSTVRTISIYGLGGVRFAQLVQTGGSPLQRFSVIAGTVTAEACIKALNQAIIDPTYASRIFTSFGFTGSGKKEADLRLTEAGQTELKLQNPSSTSTPSTPSPSSNHDSLNKFLPEDGEIKEMFSNFFNKTVETFRPLLQEVEVNYSNELLADQIHNISIILFILSVILILLFFVFIFNILLLLSTDKIINYFNNRYIIWYLKVNKKFIAMEVFFLGLFISYVMYSLSLGLQFIATHPIKF